MKKIAIAILATLSLASFSQRKMTPNEYANTYKDIAITKMKEFGIPASITLAQGMLESGYGGSRLAVRANNHFGIKCGGKWSGAKIYHNDDAKGECFRKYRSAKESYNDHSKFLTENKRYASLFNLKSTDYKGWAKGLKAAGYATDPNYANLLISMIERNELYKYDTSKGRKKSKGDKKSSRTESNIIGFERLISANNGVNYIVAQKGDNWSSLSNELGINLKRLLRINDLPASIPIREGDFIYIKNKKSKNQTIVFHNAQKGENKHSISQKYGIKERSLIRLNPVLKTREPIVGDLLRLR